MSHFIQPCFDNKGKVAWKCTLIRRYSLHKLMVMKALKALNYLLPFGPKLALMLNPLVTHRLVSPRVKMESRQAYF